MINVTISDSLKKHMDNHHATDVLVKTMNNGGCCGGNVQRVVAELVTDPQFIKALEESGCPIAKDKGKRAFFEPGLEYVDDTVTLDYKGVVIKEIKVRGTFVTFLP